MSNNEARPKYFIGNNMSGNGAGLKDSTGRSMSDSGAIPKYFTDRRNMSYSGAEPNDFTDRNTNYSGAGPKDSTGKNTSYSGARPKYSTGSNTSYRGARTKVKSSTRVKNNLESKNKERTCYPEDASNGFYHHLSVRLYDVLDDVGASAAFRKLFQDSSVLQEIIITTCYQLLEQRSNIAACYILGSSSEGTQIPSFNSDLDLLTSHVGIVLENIDEAGDGCPLLMIRDTHTHPGYVKLQSVYNGQPQTVHTRAINREYQGYDSEGRICLKHMSNINEYNDTRNGPADTDTLCNVDNVPSFRCSTIPKFSREWIGRYRQYKWPSKRMVDKMAGLGCFVVGVGYPKSIEQTIEWRLSFSLQEREMMFSMNMTQHKCYVTLKLIKKDRIETIVEKSLSSYHLKTCMFHAIENTSLSFWKHINLAQCVLLCICILLKWVYIGYCPNYFIKEENMFDRDIIRRQRLKLLHQLRFLLSHGCCFLFFIKQDNVGVVLKNGTRNLYMESELTQAWFKERRKLIQSIMMFRSSLCSNANVHDNVIAFINIIMNYMSKTKSVNGHNQQQSHEALSYLLPYIHLQQAQSYASLAFNTYIAEVSCELLQEFSYHLRKGRNCNLTSPILLEATVFLKLEQYERCICILDQLELELNQKPFSMCECYNTRCFISGERAEQLNTLSVSETIGRISTCMIFLRSDMSYTPEALNYEMFRSIYTQQVPYTHDDSWFFMAVVDAVVYLYFLQYLANAKLNRRIHKHMAIHKLESVLMREKYLGHRETGYNLLGWIHLQENLIPLAIKYFNKSWAIRPDHNAAKLHMLLLVRDINS